MTRKPKIVEAAEEVLLEEGKPLHYKAITEKVIYKCKLRGKTPHESVRSAIDRSPKFKRVAEGMYALTSWKEYKVARFAKDIAFDVLFQHGQPMDLTRLGEAIFIEREFVGSPTQVARNAIRNDERFIIYTNTDLVSLTVWDE